MYQKGRSHITEVKGTRANKLHYMKILSKVEMHEDEEGMLSEVRASR